MSDKVIRRQVLMYLSVPAVASLAACASVAPATNDDGLLQRAKEYWAYMQANERLNAWKYEAASKDKSLSLEGYFKRGGIVYESVDVRGVLRIEGDEAELDVKMRYTMPQLRLKGQEVNVRDRWRRIDGEWFHVVPHNPLFNKGS